MNKEKTPITILQAPNDSFHERDLYESMGRIVEENLKLRVSDHVYIKPNLTLPWYVPGACTNKKVLEALCKILKDNGCKISICEGDVACLLRAL